MGIFKRFLIETEELAEPCPSDFKTKKEWDAFMKTKPPKERIIPKLNEVSVPMSINTLFDNDYEWLEDEPWRTW